MPADPLQFTRQAFLRSVAGTLLLSRGLAAQPSPGKVLLVVAHPDDEYALPAPSTTSCASRVGPRTRW